MAICAVAALAQSKPLPFAAGETLSYEAKLSKIISGVPVADLTMTVSNADTGDLRIDADAKSKGTLLKLARYSFFYQFSSNIDTAVFRIEHTERKTTEKERVRNGEASFDYGEKRVTYIETDPKEPMKPPRKIASGIGDETHDIVSGIYALRLLPLSVGKRFSLTVSDTGLVYEVPVRITAREIQKTIFGKVWCYRVEPEVFGPGRMIDDKGTMVIWITDDSQRIPVRSVIKISFGKIDIRLKSVSNSKLTAKTQ
jgi:hypothetical protein